MSYSTVTRSTSSAGDLVACFLLRAGQQATRSPALLRLLLLDHSNADVRAVVGGADRDQNGAAFTIILGGQHPAVSCAGRAGGLLQTRVGELLRVEIEHLFGA